MSSPYNFDGYRTIETLSLKQEGEDKLSPYIMPSLEPKPQNPNRARDHLANERTFLAWMRTSLALLGFGAVLVRLRFLLPPELQGHSHGAQLGMAFGLVGLGLVPLSIWQFFKTRRDLERDSFEPNLVLPVAFSVAVFLLGLAVVGFVFSTTSAPVPASVNASALPGAASANAKR